jgi:hypothetical protein
MKDGLKEVNLEPSHRMIKSVPGLGQESFECWRRLYFERQKANQGETKFRDLAAFEELETGCPTCADFTTLLQE